MGNLERNADVKGSISSFFSDFTAVFIAIVTDFKWVTSSTEQPCVLSLFNSCLGEWPVNAVRGICRDAGFLHAFPLRKGSISDNTNTPLSEHTTETFMPITLRDKTNVYLEADIVISQSRKPVIQLVDTG